MSDNLRLLGPTHLGLTLQLVASSEAAGYPASNLETGNRQRFWRATGTGDQTLTYDAGVGLTVTCDTVILPRADLLVAIDADVVVQYSTDMSAWSDAFTPETPIQTNDLAAPGAADYYKEFPTQTKRGWRVKIYGTPTSPALLAGGLFLGARYEVAKNPLYGRVLGVSRSTRGLEVECDWGHWRLESDAAALRSALGAVTPDAGEAPHETVAGVVYGGLPHYLYDPLGGVFSTSGTPYLLPVLCLTPEAAMTTTPAKAIERGPTGVRWRERR